MQFMAWCNVGAQIFSTCAKRQYMAILVDKRNHVVGTGYNGGPSGAMHCKDGGCPRLFEGSAPGSSYDNCVSTHAEANALLHADYTAGPVTLYVNGPPCFACAKLIVNSTIRRVIYRRDESYEQWPFVHRFLTYNGVECLAINASQ